MNYRTITFEKSIGISHVATLGSTVTVLMSFA